MSHFLGSLLKIFLKPSRSLEPDVCSARRRVERRSRIIFMINPGQTQVGIDSGTEAQTCFEILLSAIDWIGLD